MPERRVTVAIPEGLHARPAALFVKLAGEQPATVTVARAATDGSDGADPVPANSILAVMTLGAGPGDVVVLSAEGDGADASLDALEQFLSTPEH